MSDETQGVNPPSQPERDEFAAEVIEAVKAYHPGPEFAATLDANSGTRLQELIDDLRDRIEQAKEVDERSLESLRALENLLDEPFSPGSRAIAYIALSAAANDPLAIVGRKVIRGGSKASRAFYGNSEERREKYRKLATEIWRKNPARNITWVRRQLAEDMEVTCRTVIKYTKDLKHPVFSNKLKK